MIKDFFDFQEICSMMPARMPERDVYPIKIEGHGVSLPILNSQHHEQVIYDFAISTRIQEIETDTSATAQAIMRLLTEVQSPVSHHRSSEILHRLAGHWEKTVLEPPCIYVESQTAVLRYTLGSDTATTRFDLDAGRMSMLNISDGGIIGLKTILLPTGATEASLARLHEITGNKWRYEFHTQPPKILEVCATTDNNLKNIFTHTATIDIPVFGATPGDFTTMPCEILVAPWGAGAE